MTLCAEYLLVLQDAVAEEKLYDRQRTAKAEPQDEVQNQTDGERIQIRIKSSVNGAVARLNRVSKLERLCPVDDVPDACDNANAGQAQKDADNDPEHRTQTLEVTSALCDILGIVYVDFRLGDGGLGLRTRTAALRAELRTIRDNGSGISPAERAALFERFNRHSSALSEASTGIGLSIAKRITEDQGGELILEPNSDRGCCFHLCFLKKKSRLADGW